MLLQHYLEQDVSEAALSRRFGVSRRTIHKWVESDQLDRDLSTGGLRYSPRPAVPHKRDPYTGIIDSRLEEFPGLSAKRLFDEVLAAGYPGGFSRVRDYSLRGAPTRADRVGRAVRDAAGCQGQVDFATFTLPWGHRAVGHPPARCLRCRDQQVAAVGRSEAGREAGVEPEPRNFLS